MKKKSTRLSAPPLSLRLAPIMLKEIEILQGMCETLGPGPLTRAQVVRWALVEGLPVIQKKLTGLDPESLKGRSGR